MLKLKLLKSSSGDGSDPTAEIFNMIKTNMTNEFKKALANIDPITIKNSKGDTCLHLAANKNNVDLLRFLCEEKGLSPNLVNYYGASPLYYAASSAAKQAVEYLISRKADPRLFSAFTGSRPAEVATVPDIVVLLVEYTKKFETILANPYSNFDYRMADHWRTSMQQLIHPNNNFYEGFPCYPLAKSIFDTQGLRALADRCREEEVKYEIYIDGSVVPNRTQCLICESNVDPSQQCKFCNKVLICGECHTNPDIIVNTRFQIHTNNCRKGIFK